jgi:hypothetical protein
MKWNLEWPSSRPSTRQAHARQFRRPCCLVAEKHSDAEYLAAQKAQIAAEKEKESTEAKDTVQKPASSTPPVKPDEEESWDEKEAGEGADPNQI